MIPTKAGSYIALGLSVLLLAGCATGMSSAQRQQLQQLTPSERDKLGRETAKAASRQPNVHKSGEITIQSIDYRASDDTFVYRMRIHSLANPNSLNRAQRSQFRNEVQRGFRRIICRDRTVGDMVRYGNYAVEVRVSTRNGAQLVAPVRITKADC